MRHRWVLGAALLGVILYGFPGMQTADSSDQLYAARWGELGDWHPPAMSVLWWLCECLIAGPFAMLLLQASTWVAGCYLLLRSELRPTAASVATLALCWFPPILTVMGVIWKDAQMAGYLVLGIALLRAEHRHARTWAVVLLVLGTAMRHNAPAATLAPIVLCAFPRMTGIRRWGAALALWGAITGVAVGANVLLATRAEHAWETSIATTDIVGMLRWSAPRTDDEMRELLRGLPLKAERDIYREVTAQYDPRGWLPYLRRNPPLATPGNDDEYAAVRRAWMELVTTEPLAYARHRWHVFAKVVHLGRRANVPALVTDFQSTPDPHVRARLSHEATPSRLQRVWFSIVKSWGGIWYVGYIYFVVSLVLLAFARGARNIQAILLSGLLYELSLFFAAPSADARYSQWLVATTLIAVVLLVARRARAAPQ